MEFYHLAFFEGFLYIDDALVAAASEEEVGVVLRLDEGTIHQHVDELQELQLLGVLHQVLKEIAREAPDGLLALLSDGACQLSEALCLKHRVAAREGNVGEGIAHDFLHQLLGRHHRAMVDVPRLGIVALWAVVGAAGTIYGCAEARTIYHRIVYYT